MIQFKLAELRKKHNLTQSAGADYPVCGAFRSELKSKYRASGLCAADSHVDRGGSESCEKTAE